MVVTNYYYKLTKVKKFPVFLKLLYDLVEKMFIKYYNNYKIK